MFTVKCTADDEDFEMAFRPTEDGLTGNQIWLSTDGTISVSEVMTGWMAYRHPSWEALGRIGYRTKEAAAFAACQAWVN